MDYLFSYPINQLLDHPTRLISSLSRTGRLDDVARSVVRMVLVGALVALVRSCYKSLSSKIERALFPTAYIHNTDPSYAWIRTYLATNPAAQRQIHNFQLCTEEWRNVRRKAGMSVGGRANKEGNASWVEGGVFGSIMPVYHHSIRIKHNGNYLWITRRMSSFARTKHRTIDHFTIQTIAFRKNILKDFVMAARKSFFAKEDKELLIFHAKRINPNWQSPVSRPARPWSSVILPGTVKKDLLRDVEKFLSDKEMSWYAARGIPHRRGYLFAGEPGSGKTTLTTALASKLRLDIYVVNPSQRGMDDAKLNKLFRDCPARSIILIEDIDCIFPARSRGRLDLLIDGPPMSPDAKDPNDRSQDPPADPPATPAVVGGSHDLSPSTVTLSGLLNAIDGVSSQEGCILIASTNHPERLDPALSRPGRFDVRLTFSHAIPSQAKALFLHFYPLSDFQSPSSTSSSNPTSTPTYTPTSSPESSPTPSPTGSSNSELDEKHTAPTSPSEIEEKPPAPITGQKDLDDLAKAFVSAIFPDRGGTCVGGKDGLGVSMAALQGYLLGYKEDPRRAVECAKEWAEGLDKDFRPAVRSLGLGAPPATPVGEAKEGAGGGTLRKRVLKKNKAGREGSEAREAGTASVLKQASAVEKADDEGGLVVDVEGGVEIDEVKE